MTEIIPIPIYPIIRTGNSLSPSYRTHFIGINRFVTKTMVIIFHLVNTCLFIPYQPTFRTSQSDHTMLLFEYPVKIHLSSHRVRVNIFLYLQQLSTGRNILCNFSSFRIYRGRIIYHIPHIIRILIIQLSILNLGILRLVSQIHGQSLHNLHIKTYLQPIIRRFVLIMFTIQLL